MATCKSDPDQFDDTLDLDEDAEVDHETGCIFRLASSFWEEAAASPHELWESIQSAAGLTAEQKHRLALVAAALKNQPIVPELVQQCLLVARGLEEEHLTSGSRCLPPSRWTLEKYSCSLGYRLGPERFLKVLDLISSVRAKLGVTGKGRNGATLLVSTMFLLDRGAAWDCALGELFQLEKLPPHRQLAARYRRHVGSLACATAEVHFGIHDGFRSLPRREVGDIADDLELAGKEAFLDVVDCYSDKIMRRDFPIQEASLSAKRVLQESIGQKCGGLVEELSRFHPRGYRARWDSLGRKIGLDPYLALMADIQDDAKGSQATMKRLAEEAGVAVRDIYNFRRRQKYARRRKPRIFR